MSDRILVVGGTGFLGSFVVRRLADRDPVVIVRATRQRAALPERIEVRIGDLNMPADLPLEGVDTLVYCASMGFGHVPALLDRLRESHVQRVIFLSTTAIFTSLPAASRGLRVAAEAAVQNSGLDWTILRPTMIYGTARDRNISRLLRFLKRSPVFPLCGNGLWQPIHVEDLAAAVVASLDESRTLRQTYNLAGADALRFGELVRTAAQAVGRRVVLLPVPLHVALLGARLTGVVRPEQIRRLVEDKAFSITDAERDFGFAPRTFRQGVTLEAQQLGLVSYHHG